MTKIKRTNSDDPDFQNLVHQLDEDLAIRNGDQHSFYSQFNKIDAIKNAVVYYDTGTAVGCGAFKEFDNKTVEIKRMFVRPDFRGKGIAEAILSELELWATEINYTESVLETGKTNPEALNLYQKSGYKITPNFGQYINIENSVCMKKLIN